MPGQPSIQWVAGANRTEGWRDVMAQRTRRAVLVAHPSPDRYGSDLQLLETIDAFRDQRWDVTVVLPRHGPLVELLHAHGADVRITPFPVLSKAMLSPRRLLTLIADSGRALRSAHRELTRVRPQVVWVNTLTEPVWVLAGRLARLPVVCHVHEAEEDVPRPVRIALAGPLLLTRAVVVNSSAARRALVDVLPRLQGRIRLVHNGMSGPPGEVTAPRSRLPHDPLRVALAGRIAPRKGTDLALEAVARLRREGLAVTLHLYGTVFSGYEWFEQQLRARAQEPDLRGSVTFHGYVSPIWQAMGAADLVLVPSRAEPFGNVAVEAMLSCRPVVAAAVQGLTEIVVDGETGLLAAANDADSLADRIREVALDPARAAQLAVAGRERALERFTAARYREQVLRVLEDCLPGGRQPG